MENKLIEGWCHVIDTICDGPVIAWKTGTGDNTVPLIWSTQEEARKELIQEYIYHLESYVDGNRDWDQTDTNGPEDWVAVCRIEDGQLIVHSEDGDLLINMPITEWRKSL